MEIDYNKSTLLQESLQRSQRRLLIEVCNGDNFIKTASGQTKCMVRLEFQRVQKKTKKNLNCKNPKFYEIFRFPIRQ